jgi:hypothetical protein
MGAEAGKDKPVSITVACQRLELQLVRLGAFYPLLSTNVEPRMDGTPRAGRAAPADPGAAVYFAIRQQPYVLACDTFDEVAQNVAALANHLDATRRIARYGVASAAETLQAFAALPPPGRAKESRWWRVLHISTGAEPPNLGPVNVARAVINGSYREACRIAHANGGDHETMVALNLARDEALKTLELDHAASR